MAFVVVRGHSRRTKREASVSGTSARFMMRGDDSRGKEEAIATAAGRPAALGSAGMTAARAPGFATPAVRAGSAARVARTAGVLARLYCLAWDRSCIAGSPGATGRDGRITAHIGLRGAPVRQVLQRWRSHGGPCDSTPRVA